MVIWPQITSPDSSFPDPELGTISQTSVLNACGHRAFAPSRCTTGIALDKSLPVPQGPDRLSTLGKGTSVSGPGHGGDGGDGDAEDDNKASDDDLAATRGPFLPQVRSPRHLI